MNVLLITRWFPSKQSEISGIFIQEQAVALSIVNNVSIVYVNVDYQNFSLTTKANKYYRKISESLEEYHYIFLKSAPIYNQLNFIFGAYREILKICKNKKFDIVHSHVTFQAGLIGLMISKKLKLPLVITEHSNWNPGFFPSKIHKSIASYTLKHADCVIPVSLHSAYILNKYCERNYEVVYNIIDINKFQLSQKLKNSNIHIGFLGGLDTPIKGLDILLDSLAKCKDIDFTLHIGGGGKLVPKLKDHSQTLGISERCVFHGAIPPHEVPSFFKKLDFFVVASRSESFGVVILEALASGIPVVATRCGGPEELITHTTGILVDKEDIQDLERGIRLMCATFEKFDKLHMRQYVNNKFGADVYTSKVTEIYKREIYK